VIVEVVEECRSSGLLVPCFGLCLGVKFGKSESGFCISGGENKDKVFFGETVSRFNLL